MRLFGVELDRFVSRSVVQWVVVFALILAASGALLSYGVSMPMPESERARAVESFESMLAEWQVEHETWYEECLVDEAIEREADPSTDWQCEWALEEPRLSEWLMEPTFIDTGVGLLLGLVSGLLALGLLAAVSFVAAEFSTGAIGNWLTFEPRRVRVYLAKLAAAVVGVVSVVGVGFVVALGATYAPFAYHGTTGEVTDQHWREFAAMGGRVVLAAAMVAVIAVALAFLVRHLAAALGVAIGWLLIFELLLGVAYPRTQRWTVANNLRALTDGGASYSLDVCTLGEDGRRVCSWTELPISALQGGLVLGGIAVVLTIVALLVFRRRDVF